MSTNLSFTFEMDCRTVVETTTTKKNAIIQATLEIIFNLQYVDRENILQNYTLRMTFNMRIYFSIVSDLS